MSEVTPEQLDALEAAEKAATRAPWAVERHGIMDATRSQTFAIFPDDAEGNADVELIVALRNAAPELLAMARRTQNAEAASREAGDERDELSHRLLVAGLARAVIEGTAARNADERDAAEGERDALAARVSLLEEALRRCIEIDEAFGRHTKACEHSPCEACTGYAQAQSDSFDLARAALGGGIPVPASEMTGDKE